VTWAASCTGSDRRWGRRRGGGWPRHRSRRHAWLAEAPTSLPAAGEPNSVSLSFAPSRSFMAIGVPQDVVGGGGIRRRQAELGGTTLGATASWGRHRSSTFRVGCRRCLATVGEIPEHGLTAPRTSRCSAPPITACLLAPRTPRGARRDGSSAPTTARPNWSPSTSIPTPSKPWRRQRPARPTATRTRSAARRRRRPKATPGPSFTLPTPSTSRERPMPTSARPMTGNTRSS
jgi:hypothetical protein